MYLIKLEDEQMKELFQIREELKKDGIKFPISKQVRYAVKEYLEKKIF